MTILAYVSQKGGATKSTSTVNMAHCLALLGKRVLVVDVDPQGAATILLGFEPDENNNMFQVMKGDIFLSQILLPTSIDGVTLAPSDIELAGAEVLLATQAGWHQFLRTELDRVSARFDYCLIDSPPSLGILAQLALLAADIVLIPLQCHFLALRALKQLMRIIQRMLQRGVTSSIDLLIFRTMYDERTPESQQISQEIQRIAGTRLLETVIHYTSILQRPPKKGKTRTIFDMLNRQKRSKYVKRTADEYMTLTKEVVTYVEGR